MASRKMLTVLAAALLVGGTGCGDDENGIGPSTRRSPHFWRVRADSSGDYPTIQEALCHALPGDTVAVAEGTYFESPIIDKPVAFLGGWDNDFTAPDPYFRRTILDGRSLGTVLSVSGAPDTSTVVSGFVITGGGYAKSLDGAGLSDLLASDAPPGSGILCDGASPLISHNTIEENAAPYGAGILCLRGAARIRSNTIEGNRALKDGGGILCLEFSGDLSLNVIRNNEAAGEGGGLHLTESEGSSSGDIIEDNRSGAVGGGAVCRASDFAFTSVIVRTNHATSSGGGLYIERESHPEFDGCTIEGNESDGGGAGVYCAHGSAPAFVSCELSSNVAQGSGGALYARAPFSLLHCRILDNQAALGGGIYCGRDALADVRRSLFADNSGRGGGAVTTTDDAEAAFYRNTFFENAASTAGGVFYLITGDIRLERNLVIGSTEGEAVYCWADVSLEILKNDFWNNADGDFGGACVEPPAPDPDGNIFEDPLFCDPENGDFNLQTGSPAVTDADTLGAFPSGCTERRKHAS